MGDFNGLIPPILGVRGQFGRQFLPFQTSSYINFGRKQKETIPRLGKLKHVPSSKALDLECHFLPSSKQLLIPSHCKMPDQILDKEGRSYSIVITEDEPHFAIQVFDRQVLVGEVKCRQEKPGVLYLRDIAIANNVVCRTINIRTKSFKQTLSYREKATNYRDRGLGSALLQFLIHYAQTKGVHSLYGKVYQQDIENNPKLLQWYQRHGFELRQPPPEDQPDVINLIYRAIAVLNPVSE